MNPPSPTPLHHTSARAWAARIAPTRSAALAGLAGLALLTASCGGGGSENVAGGTIAGSMIVLQPSNSTLEAEPNDDVGQAHVIGTISPGETRSVLGAITSAGGDDFDAFRFTATSRVSVALELVTENGTADLDVYILDPVSLQEVERYTTNSASESGVFLADGSFFVVIDAFTGDSAYELRLTATAAPSVIAEVEPNDNGGEAMYLGVLTDAESISLSGSVGGTDAFDRFLVAVPAAGPFSFSLTHGGSGVDFDVRLSDATADFVNPTSIQLFNSGTSPETGMINLGAMTLVELRIEPFALSGPWQLSIQAGAMPRLAALDGPVAALSTAPRGNVDRVNARWRSAGSARSFDAVSTPLWNGDVILSPRSEVDVDMRLASRGGRTAARVPNGPRKVSFELPDNLDDAQRARYTVALAATLAGAEGVEFAEPDYRVFPLFDTRPNDTHYNLQWHYEQIQLPAAWDITRGSSSVRVAVLDTGSTPHPDLAGREIAGIDMISSATIAGDGNGIDNDPFDVGDSNGVQPSSFHGSHVAGTIGAVTDNSTGVAGVTWLGGIMHVRVLGIGGGSTFDILNGILYAAGLANSSNQVPAQAADVINMSLGGSGFSQATQNAVTAARNAGVVIIAAAGNENSSQPSYPAAYDGVVSVAAVDFEGNRAPYSNFHATVDIAAPGGDVSRDRNGDGYADGVLSTKPDDSVNPTNYASYAFYQGTSMAAPHVAGVAALVLAVDPNLTPAQVESILTSTATDLGATGRDNIYGNGLVNAFAAVQAAGGGGGGGSPVLSLASSTVLFSSRSDVARIGVANVGGSSLAVQSVTATTNSGGNWLSAARVTVTGSAATDTSAIDVTVSATSLADGFYSGQIDVQSTGGSATLDVTLVLGAGTGSSNYIVYVLAVDATTFETLAQDEVQTSALSNGYSLPGLDDGDYYIVAGTDEDNDGFICDPGEPLCGLYPSLGLPEVLTISNGTSLTGRNFPLESALLPASVSQGFRRLNHSPEVAR